MKYISLTAMIMSVALADIATAVNANGETCTHVDAVDCGILAGYNNGHSFLYYCMGEESNPDIGQISVIRNCSCTGCCDAFDGCMAHPP
ncbi:hypothetical protein K503DRAFT_776730 [Rhizopogon vinicolor AM-OR11-026]|uniref:Uncharacterized protein n=1 Tax=Rhizopogon vinicolor AM-OR11-026 TaxID=1314800 RepID=A0A1B7MIG2_9AGAM|nr:hypothetical protein K503DRAFT_776730 [Rhizopogon vinicolor AM-OR11-026]